MTDSTTEIVRSDDPKANPPTVMQKLADAILLVDEIENGVYYTHMTAIWRAVISLLRKYEAQMFVSTHSRECLQALAQAAADDVHDIAVWRTERAGDTHTIRRFDGEDFKAGINYGEEVR